MVDETSPALFTVAGSRSRAARDGIGSPFARHRRSGLGGTAGPPGFGQVPWAIKYILVILPVCEFVNEWISGMEYRGSVAAALNNFPQPMPAIRCVIRLVMESRARSPFRIRLAAERHRHRRTPQQKARRQHHHWPTTSVARSFGRQQWQCFNLD